MVHMYETNNDDSLHWIFERLRSHHSIRRAMHKMNKLYKDLGVQAYARYFPAQ